MTLSIALLRYLKHRREKKRKEQALRRVRELHPSAAESAVKRDEGGKGRSVWERGEWEGVPVSLFVRRSSALGNGADRVGFGRLELLSCLA